MLSYSVKTRSGEGQKRGVGLSEETENEERERGWGLGVGNDFSFFCSIFFHSPSLQAFPLLSNSRNLPPPSSSLFNPTLQDWMIPSARMSRSFSSGVGKLGFWHRVISTNDLKLEFQNQPVTLLLPFLRLNPAFRNAQVCQAVFCTHLML